MLTSLIITNGGAATNNPFSFIDGALLAVLGIAAGFCIAGGIKYGKQWWQEHRAAKGQRLLDEYQDRALLASLVVSALALVFKVDLENGGDSADFTSEHLDDDGFLTYITLTNPETEEVAAILTDLKHKRLVVEYIVPIDDEEAHNLKWTKSFDIEDAENMMGFKTISWIEECRRTELAGLMEDNTTN